MPWVYIICFALIAAGLLTLFGVRPGDFIDALFRSQRKSATLTDELNVLMGTPAKGFFNQDFELKQILKGTGRCRLPVSAPCRQCPASDSMGLPMRVSKWMRAFS